MDYMPNLKSFTLKCIHGDITKYLIKKFINKIMIMKLNYIEFHLTNKKYCNKDDEYTINELKKICPQFDINQFNHISIGKL